MEETMKLNLNNIKLAITTTYTGRRSETPYFSIGKSGCSILNTAFIDTFFKSKKSRDPLFIQAASLNGKYYLLVSTKKKPNFYMICNNGANKLMSTCISGFKSTFGKQGVTMRYTTELIETTDSTVKAFLLKNVIEDLIVTKEK